MSLQAGAALVMSVILVLSPHLDDAAFSVGPLLAELSDRAEVFVATAFTKSEPKLSEFALACQLDKGLSADADYMAIRRREDLEWSRRVGAPAVHGALAEAPHRGYQSARELFGAVLATDQLEGALKAWFEVLISTFRPTVILCPMGVGNHVDHVWVRKVASATFGHKFPLFFFKDLPYSSKLNSFHVEDYLGSSGTWRELKVPLSQTAVSKAQFAVEAYQTQIAFQFGHIDQMRNTLNEAWTQCLPLFYSHSFAEAAKVLSPTALENICPA